MIVEGPSSRLLVVQQLSILDFIQKYLREDKLHISVREWHSNINNELIKCFV